MKDKIELNKLELQMEIQEVAPDYQACAVTIRDRYGIESKRFLPSGKISKGDIEALLLLHVHYSQGITRRN